MARDVNAGRLMSLATRLAGISANGCLFHCRANDQKEEAVATAAPLSHDPWWLDASQCVGRCQEQIAIAYWFRMMAAGLGTVAVMADCAPYARKETAFCQYRAATEEAALAAPETAVVCPEVAVALAENNAAAVQKPLVSVEMIAVVVGVDALAAAARSPC